MKEYPENPDNDEKPEEGYPVAPLPPGVGEIPELKIPPRPHRPFIYESAEKKEPFQYTLADMFALTTAVAMFMSILSFFPLPTIAGASGIGALFSLILLAIWPPEQPLLRLGWWVLFVLYLLACIGAIIFGR
jgi:hypothetical protein